MVVGLVMQSMSIQKQPDLQSRHDPVEKGGAVLSRAS